VIATLYKMSFEEKFHKNVVSFWNELNNDQKKELPFDETELWFRHIATEMLEQSHIDLVDFKQELETQSHVVLEILYKIFVNLSVCIVNDRSQTCFLEIGDIIKNLALASTNIKSPNSSNIYNLLGIISPYRTEQISILVTEICKRLRIANRTIKHYDVADFMSSVWESLRQLGNRSLGVFCIFAFVQTYPPVHSLITSEAEWNHILKIRTGTEIFLRKSKHTYTMHERTSFQNLFKMMGYIELSNIFV